MKIKILSPVHIGSGEKRNRLAFIEENGKAYLINEDMFSKEIINGNLLDKFTQWAKQGGNDILQFLKDYPDIKKKLLEKPLYVLPIRGFIDREVALHIKDSNNQFFIPGSSIKGAVRTALLYTVLEETKPNINQLLEGIPNTDIKGVLNVEKKEAKRAGMEIEKFVFRAGYRKDDGTISYNDAKFDLLKFIHFSDAYPIKAEYSIMPIRTVSSVSKTLMNMKHFITNAEVIESGEFNCNLEIDMKGLLALKDINKKDEWIDSEEKVYKVFGFQLSELTPNNLKEYEGKIVKRLLEVSSIFFQKKKEKDLELISYKDENNLLKWKEIQVDNKPFGAESLKNKYPEMKEGIIELGFGGGWKGKTVGLYFDRKKIDSFRIRFKNRWSGKFHQGRPFWLFPKTMRVAFWMENDRPFIFPLGWICLEL